MPTRTIVITEEELATIVKRAYLAGVFDGEGCTEKDLRLSVQTKGTGILEQFTVIFPAVIQYSKGQKKEYRRIRYPKGRTATDSPALKVAEFIAPFLTIKKGEVEALIRAIKAEHVDKKEYEQAMRELLSHKKTHYK